MTATWAQQTPPDILAAIRRLANPAPPERRWATPGELAKHLDPRTVQTPALDLIDDELVRLADEPGGRLIISMPPQMGKSQRVARDFIIWALLHNPETRVVVGSYAQGLANRNGRAIRNLIATRDDLGIKIAPDHGSVSEWQLADHRGGVLSVGRGAGVTGRPADLIVIDDPLKDRTEADSETTRQTCWDWWTDSLNTRLSPGAPVVLIQTRWHADDLAGRLIEAPDGHRWRVINLPAEADHDPTRGESDPLDREPGEYLTTTRSVRDPKTGRERPMTPDETRANWESIKIAAGSRTWAALYQGRPSAAEGDMLKREWWRTYDALPWIVRDDGSHWVTDPNAEVMISADLAFKDTASSDFVAIGVWMRRGVDCYLLDLINERLDFVSTCQRLRQIAAKWPQATLKLVEDKANGPAVIAALSRTVPGIVPEEPQGSKVARVSAITPLVESGNVHLPAPEIAPWVSDFIEQCAAFPNGRHDDMVDQMSQALNRLVLQPLLRGDDLTMPAEFDTLLERGWTVSPY